MKAEQEIRYRIVGGVSGLVLALANFRPVFAPVQFLAFGMILYLGLKSKAGCKHMLVAGLYMGLGFCLPQITSLKMHVVVTVILLVYLGLAE